MAETVREPTRGTSHPDRFWTTTNTGEAAPDLLSPMCWSLWGAATERGFRNSMYAFGVLPRQALAVPADINEWGLAVFYGRLAMNVDVLRSTLASLPGVKGDDLERDLLGSVREHAPAVKGDPRRLPAILAKTPLALLTQRRRIHRAYASTRTWWVNDVHFGGATGRPVDRMEAALGQYSIAMGQHCVSRFIFSGAQSVLSALAEKMEDPLLASQLMSGVGDVLETKMADDLWRLGHGHLDESSFMSEWGYHGPHEGNVTAVVWREDPTPVRSLARSYVRRGTERPSAREARATLQAAEAEARLLQGSPRWQRPALRWFLTRYRNVTRLLQMGKASYLMHIDGVREAVRAFGKDQVARGALAQPEDAFFLSIEECRLLEAGRLPEAKDLVESRQMAHALYRTIALPVSWNGMPDPVVRESDNSSEQVVCILAGAASGGGVVEGRARVLRDVSEEIELEDGDILVCRFTDPSWAPLMALADGLVIDIGGSASHGAVVARELGIPYVIGTARGTELIRDGERLRVDGERNLVTMLERLDPASA